MGVKVVLKEDQNHTDSEKAINYLDEEVFPTISDIERKNIKIITLGTFGGRMDHTMQNISILWKKSLKTINKKYEILMLNNRNLLSVLKPHRNELRLSKNVESNMGCGLVPLTECTSISTTGLLYNMGN